MADNDKRRFNWHEPLTSRGRTLLVVVAAAIVVGAVVVGIALGIPFF